MKKIYIGVITILALGFISRSLYNVVQETDEVLQFAPHIMDTPSTMDLSDTMVFHTKDTFNTKEK